MCIRDSTRWHPGVYGTTSSARCSPERFPDLNKFDIERPQRTRWLGPQQSTAIETFLRRVDNPRLVEDPPPYRINEVFPGPRHLFIDLDGIRN